MKKKISLFLIFAFLFTNCAFGWFSKKQKPEFFLSSINPSLITDFEKQKNTADVFKVNTRIYFSIYNEEGFKSQYIKYQILRQDDNAFDGGYSKIRNITLRVSNPKYYSDYFVISRCGKYYIQIFDITNLNHWLAMKPFMVVD